LPGDFIFGYKSLKVKRSKSKTEGKKEEATGSETATDSNIWKDMFELERRENDALRKKS